MVRFKITTVTLVAALAWPLAVPAQDSADTLATRLVEMRAQTDRLQNELSLMREEHKNRMAYLTAQLTELEAGRDREALRVRQLEQQLEQSREAVAGAGAGAAVLLPVLERHLASLREQVRTGFPFKVGERLAELDDLESQLRNGVVTVERGFNRLWAFIEDELRISRENAIYSQSVTLQGQNVLVDIAKLGNAMLYFRTRDLRYGRAVETSEGWRFELLESIGDQEQVALLFDSLRKQIRQGYFTLPNALPRAAEVSS